MGTEFSYIEFENRFRGESPDVKREQEGYVSYFRSKRVILDIGCGRGEFLELLRENNVIDAYGIDINDEMLDCCRKKRLRVFRDDAISHLKKLEDGSLDGVFASHVVEHLPPSQVLELIPLLHRKMNAGAHLVSETLNPQCLFSFGPFFMDPTHISPVHPQTFRFILEAGGFHEIEFRNRQFLPEDFLRLNQISLEQEKLTPLEEAYSKTVAKLQTIIDLVFMNFIYSVIARK